MLIKIAPTFFNQREAHAIDVYHIAFDDVEFICATSIVMLFSHMSYEHVVLAAPFSKLPWHNESEESNVEEDSNA